MSTSSPSSFIIGHEESTSSSSVSIYLLFPKKHDIEQVEFRCFGALLSKPVCTVKSPTYMDYNGKARACFQCSNYDKDFPAVIRIYTKSGRKFETRYFGFGQERVETKFRQVMEWKKRWSVRKLVDDRTFGVELELSDANGNSKSNVAAAMETYSGLKVIPVESYASAHVPISNWKLVHDGSLECNSYSPSCSKFELVSPIPVGEQGLRQCQNILQSLKASSRVDIAVNKTMGFHVHIKVGKSLVELKKLCQNFIKYEDAIDTFMPASRRGFNRFCRSNKTAIKNPSGSVAKLNGARHRAIDACKTRAELCQLMNPEGRYYKLNLQNLVTGRQPTVEFRQHSATANPEKVLAWVRFCMAFVSRSSTKPAPTYLKNDMDPEEVFYDMFENFIQCRVLQDFYEDRVATLVDAPYSSEDSPCCSGCAHGHGCSSGVQDLNRAMNNFAIRY